MGLFDKRVAFKPFEYPEATGYKDAINHSYWLVSEWNFIGDKHDFKATLDPIQRNAIKNTLLAISQIEVSVKRFWGKLGERFPKAEFEQVGATFSESEVRHADAYSHLLKVLDLNGDFEKVLDVPAIKGRVEYLSKYMRGGHVSVERNYALTLTLFSMFVENVSLFSQFAVIKSFNKHMNVLKDVDNVIQATQKEETIHALFGSYLVNLIKKEHPDWFDKDFYQQVADAATKAYEAEAAIIDWIFEAGELSFLPKQAVKELIAKRLNESLVMIGADPQFVVDKKAIKPLKWFEEELHADTHVDFFHKRSTGYAKKTKPVKAEDLF
jgi:ribonucleoside-diphosphate reductase beta chain